MSKILVDVDDESLRRAADVLGTTTKKDTVNTALREIAERTAKARAFADLLDMGERGDFDTLKDKANYRP